MKVGDGVRPPRDPRLRAGTDPRPADRRRPDTRAGGTSRRAGGGARRRRTPCSPCVAGIRARREHLAAIVAGSTGLVTALNPALGYETACAIALEAHRDGRPLLDLVRERTALTEEQLAALLAPDVLTGRRTVV